MKNMALELKRLIKNLANLKHKQTLKNKFLKTKPKIQEMKQNVEKANEEAIAFHDYVKRAEVGMDPAGVIPPMEKDSFKPLVETLTTLFASSLTTTERAALIASLESSLNIGIAVTNSGQRYLTTRARATELGASFTEMNSTLANVLSGGTGTLK
jgi:hypothetical protein